MTHNRKPDVLPVEGASIAEALHALACLEGPDYQSPYVTAAYYRAVRSALERAAAEGEARPAQEWRFFRDGSPAEQQPIWQWHPDYPNPAAVFYFGVYGSGWMWLPRYVEPAPAPPKGSTP